MLRQPEAGPAKRHKGREGRLRAAGSSFLKQSENKRAEMVRQGKPDNNLLDALINQLGSCVQIPPKGTVSPGLGTGRGGAVQLAHALGLPVLPVGMSGCPSVFFASTPVPIPGKVTIRIGAPLEVALPVDHRAFEPEDERRNHSHIAQATARLMGGIDALLDDEFRFAPDRTPPGKGLRALL